MPYMRTNIECGMCGTSHSIRTGNPEVATPEECSPLSILATDTGMRIVFRCLNEVCGAVYTLPRYVIPSGAKSLTDLSTKKTKEGR